AQRCTHVLVLSDECRRRQRARFRRPSRGAAALRQPPCLRRRFRRARRPCRGPAKGRAAMNDFVIDCSRYRVEPGSDVALADWSTDDTQGLEREAAKSLTRRNIKAVDRLQRRLYAESRQSLLIV